MRTDSHMRLILVLLSLASLLAFGVLIGTSQSSSAHALGPAMTPQPKRGWPYPVPLRVRDGANRNLMVMTLGDVQPSLADGMYDPTADKATLKDGSVIEHYYRD